MATVAIGEETDDGMDESRGAEGEPDDGAPADAPRAVRPRRGSSGSLARAAKRLGGQRQAEADERHDDDRASGVGEPRERLAQSEREERPSADRRPGPSRIALASRIDTGPDEDRLRQDEPGDRQPAREVRHRGEGAEQPVVPEDRS